MRHQNAGCAAVASTLYDGYAVAAACITFFDKVVRPTEIQSSIVDPLKETLACMEVDRVDAVTLLPPTSCRLRQLGAP